MFTERTVNIAPIELLPQPKIKKAIIPDTMPYITLPILLSGVVPYQSRRKKAINKEPPENRARSMSPCPIIPLIGVSKKSLISSPYVIINAKGIECLSIPKENRKREPKRVRKPNLNAGITDWVSHISDKYPCGISAPICANM